MLKSREIDMTEISKRKYVEEETHMNPMKIWRTESERAISF